jgi:hypothetical protein
VAAHLAEFRSVITEAGQGVVSFRCAPELEPAHRLVSALDAAMILLNPVVETTIGPMAYSFAEFGSGSPLDSCLARSS